MPWLRNSMSREVVAWLVGLAVSPLAFPIVSVVDAYVALAFCDVAGIPLSQPDRELLFLFARDPFVALFGSYTFISLLVFPPLILLRARGWLTAATAIGSALWIPLTGAATMTLLFAYQAAATTAEMLGMFAFLAYLIVPGTTATACLFWVVYSRLRRGMPQPHEVIDMAEPCST